MDLPAETNSDSMLRHIFLNERGMRAGTRIAIFLLMWLTLHSHSVPRLVPALFNLLHLSVDMKHSQSLPLTPGRFFVYPFLEFMVLLFACWIMSKIERRGMGGYGLPWKIQAWPVFFSGLVLSLSSLTTLIITIHLFKGIEFSGWETQGAEALKYGLYWAITFLMVGFAEEYVFRGYMLATMTEGIDFWPSATLLSVCFALVHTGNRGENRSGIFSVFVAGMVLAYFVKVTGNLWFSVGFHAGWDWTQSFLFGVPDSGLVSAGRWLVPVIHGPEWLTGGSAGPEGSIFCPVLLILFAIAIGRIYAKKKLNQKTMEPSGI